MTAVHARTRQTSRAHQHITRHPASPHTCDTVHRMNTRRASAQPVGTASARSDGKCNARPVLNTPSKCRSVRRPTAVTTTSRDSNLQTYLAIRRLSRNGINDVLRSINPHRVRHDVSRDSSLQVEQHRSLVRRRRLQRKHKVLHDLEPETRNAHTAQGKL